MTDHQINDATTAIASTVVEEDPLMSAPLRLELEGDTDLQKLAETIFLQIKNNNAVITDVDVCVHDTFVEKVPKAAIVAFFDKLGSHLLRLRKLEFYPGDGSYNIFPMQALGATLQHARHLETLYVYHLELDGDHEQFTTFSRQLQGCTSLKEFCFIDCQTAEENTDNPSDDNNAFAFDTILRALGSMPSLQVVAIWANDLGQLTPDSLVKVCQSLSIERLMILGFNLSDMDASVIFKTLEHNKILKRLNISCTFGSESSRALSQLLIGKSLLEKLKLELESPVDHRNLLGVALALQRNKTLDYLKVSGDISEMNDEDANDKTKSNSKSLECAFTSMLETNVSLETLSLLDGSIHSPLMDLYLKLNIKGRRQLLLQSGKVQPTSLWLKALVDSNGDIDCLFCFLQMNPALFVY